MLAVGDNMNISRQHAKITYSFELGKAACWTWLANYGVACHCIECCTVSKVCLNSVSWARMA